MTLYEKHRELVRGLYMCNQHKHVLLEFLPGGTLRVYGEANHPFMHKYSITHRGDQWFMETTPALMSEPAEMEMFMIKGAMTLKSSKLDENGKPFEELNFNKSKHKGF